MIRDYRPLLDKVECALSTLDFSLSINSDYVAVFERKDGWKIYFEGERYQKPAFDLSIEIDNYKYPVRMLMIVFSVDGEPSLEQQLKFIVSSEKDLFVSPQGYLSEYRKIDSIDI